MQLSITLDLSTLNPSQIKGLTGFLESFVLPYVVPTSDELEVVTEGVRSPKRRRKTGDIPAHLATPAQLGQSEYADLLAKITNAMVTGKLTEQRLGDALHYGEVHTFSDILNSPDPVGAISKVTAHLGDLIA